jgi:hydrogenase maturation protein HypF
MAAPQVCPPDSLVERRRLKVRGAVQGVGFRPFVYRLARELALSGHVENSPQGVTVEVEGAATALAEFQRRLDEDRPPAAFLESVDCEPLPSTGAAGFEIRRSDLAGERSALILPDRATCADCCRELLTAGDRRHRYPFTNCTRCGPRYSIVLSLPYDRQRTTMAGFALCAACRAEYEDPADRRFHAEPNACPVCGPQLALWDAAGRELAVREQALQGAAEALRGGQIVAVKGLGGFHLLVDARDQAAVLRLRERKRREAKPLAVMFPDLLAAAQRCVLEPEERTLLASAEAPIVLVRAREDIDIAPAVAPGNPHLGALLPYTPLHLLLLRELGFPVVATSGNLAEEPLCIDEAEAVERLSGIADLLLVHDRPIARPVEDSVVRLMAGRPMLLRRARGHAPLPVAAAPAGRTLLAVGAHLKNTVAVVTGGRLLLGAHAGDLESERALSAFRGSIETLSGLFEAAPEAVACDQHPDYLSTQHARQMGLPVLAVQHHLAHVLAAMADNELEPPVLGLAWDGTGLGPDGTIWGGEALRVERDSWERVGWLRPFLLPGGDRAVREPRRSALGVLYALEGDRLFESDEPVLALFAPAELPVLRSMLQRRVNTPTTSSAGRLFDAVAALAGLASLHRFEGEAAMALEFAVGASEGHPAYPFELREANHHGRAVAVDWAPLIEEVRADRARGGGLRRIATRFHEALAEIAVALAVRTGERQVVLTGGCFQNRQLTERAVARLRAAGFEVHWHRRIPPNDGGIAAGQAVWALAELARKDAALPPQV